MAIKTALLFIGEDDKQNETTRNEAKSLASSMDTLETALTLVLWNVILKAVPTCKTKTKTKTKPKLF